MTTQKIGDTLSMIGVVALSATSQCTLAWSHAKNDHALSVAVVYIAGFLLDRQ